MGEGSAHCDQAVTTDSNVIIVPSLGETGSGPMTRSSSSVIDSSGACIVATGTLQRWAAVLTSFTRESGVNTLLEPFLLPLGFGGMFRVRRKQTKRS